MPATCWTPPRLNWSTRHGAFGSRLVDYHAVAEAVGRFLPEGRNMGLSGLIWLPQELYVLILALLVGLVAALLPAIQAYRTDIAALLASRA
jgi:putative ABC transport system permease protein